MRVVAALAAVVWLGASPAFAGVESATAGGFVLQAEAEVAASPDQVWRRLPHVERWWSGEHTYSGDARRLSLDPRAGGCWCERWGDGQSIEHMHVVLVTEHDGVRTLPLTGGLGPLQELAVNGALTFTVAPLASGAKIAMTYRVSGDPALGLDQMAPLVDSVLWEQFGRFSRYSTTGSPE